MGEKLSKGMGNKPALLEEWTNELGALGKFSYGAHGCSLSLSLSLSLTSQR
jgi:hypothetical protein